MKLWERPLVLWFAIISYMLMIFYLSSLSYPPQPLGKSKQVPIIEHFIEFGILGALLLPGFSSLKKTKKHALIFAIFVGIFYGITDEIHQSFVPGRYPSFFDVIIDSFGVLAGVLFIRGKKI